jgi:hypothetical protein
MWISYSSPIKGGALTPYMGIRKSKVPAFRSRPLNRAGLENAT